MLRCDTFIRNATLYDGSSAEPEVADVAIHEDRIVAIGPSLNITASTIINAESLALARGLIREGYYADLVLFDPATIIDTATFDHPARSAKGIISVWVNGVPSYTVKGSTQNRAGQFLPRNSTSVSTNGGQTA